MTVNGNSARDELFDDTGAATDDDKDNLICGIFLNADNYHLCKAKTSHKAILRKIDASIPTKTFTGTHDRAGTQGLQKRI